MNPFILSSFLSLIVLVTSSAHADYTNLAKYQKVTGIFLKPLQLS